MSTYPMRQRSPFSDRSNSRSPPPTAAPVNRSLNRRTSRKQFFPHLDSSEDIPSEHSSVYDAMHWRSADHLDHVYDEDEATDAPATIPKHGGPNGGSADGSLLTLEIISLYTEGEKNSTSSIGTQDAGIRFINRPHGTPLATIIEQKSIATLRTAPSFPSVKRNFTPIHTSSNSHYLHTTSSTINENRRRISFSVDELALRGVQRWSEDSAHSNSAAPVPADAEVLGSDITRAVSPPFQPPKRIKTPDGLPRWPGDLPTARPYLSSTSANPARALLNYLRNSRSPRSTQPAARSETRPQRTGRAFWRPPVSGHAAVGFAELTSHPFHNAPVAAPDGTTAGVRQGRKRSIPSPPSSITASLAGRAENPTAARKALGAIFGNAVPVAPARVLSAKGIRSVSLPSRYQSKPQQPRTTSSSTAPKPSVANIGSTPTIDLIAQFPLPPTAARTPAPPTPPTRPVDASPPPAPSTTAHVPARLPSPLDLGEGVLSGPRRDRNRVGCLQSLRSLSGSTRSSSGPHTPLRPTSPAPDFSFGPRSGVTDPASLYRLTLPAPIPSPLPRIKLLPARYAPCPVLLPSTPVRGEATTRYTLPGMPIYRPTAPSLRALDCRAEREHEHEHAGRGSIAASIASIRSNLPPNPSNTSPADNRYLDQQEMDAQRCPQASDPHSPHRSSTTASRGTHEMAKRAAPAAIEDALTATGSSSSSPSTAAAPAQPLARKRSKRPKPKH
ncbi:hypothetical protein B0A49_10880 [Cryomyces minteri]|uniref:Uncharacterized protein n=1 Tax=Cryomyces minteri TaxID=331657 RepID=A0A4U0WIQ0_9PEZI|nr:hypothetical protein B0A49_10880 [Cryomyces minteri]